MTGPVFAARFKWDRSHQKQRCYVRCDHTRPRFRASHANRASELSPIPNRGQSHLPAAATWHLPASIFEAAEGEPAQTKNRKGSPEPKHRSAYACEPRSITRKETRLRSPTYTPSTPEFFESSRVNMFYPIRSIRPGSRIHNDCVTHFVCRSQISACRGNGLNPVKGRGLICECAIGNIWPARGPRTYCAALKSAAQGICRAVSLRPPNCVPD
jgi:hypothetical protein